MKEFLKKRWHRIPVALVSALLVIALVAGGAFAAYGFLKADIQVEVEEAIAVGTFDTWDNLHPYGSDPEAVWEDSGAHDDGTGVLGDVTITLSEDGIAIATAAETPFVGEGFTAGEWIVIPVNIRSGSSGELTLGASWDDGGSGLILEHTWQENDIGEDFKASGAWASLSAWNPTITGPYGKSGSAVVGAKVLFVKIGVPRDAVPGDYTLTVELNRY